MSIIDQMRVLLREHKEEAEARKAAIKPDPPHVTVAAWQIDAAKFASNVAMCVLVYMLWLYTLQIAGDRAGEMHLTHAGTWTGDLQFWFPYLVGFALISFGVPYVAKISIPTFMALTWREAPWPKGWALGIAMSVSLVIIAGTFTIQGDAILERDRDSAVAVAGIEQNRAGLQARIDGITADLNTMMNNSNAYLAQAASVGAAEWENTYIANARASNDPQLGRIERALGAARSADTLRAERDTLRQQLAAAPVAETAQRRVEGASTATSFIGSMLDWVEGIRAILLSLVMDVVCLMMPWIARHLELTRNRQLGMGDNSGWADDAHRIEDHTADDPLPVQPMKGPREVVRDAETGEELIKITPKAHWRKKKGKPQRIEADVMAMADETGAPDGGARAGSVAESVAQDASNEDEAHGADQRSFAAAHETVGEVSHNDGDAPQSDQRADESGGHSDGLQEFADQPTLPELTPEQELALLADEPVSESADATIEQGGQEQAESETAEEYVPAFPALTYERAVAADDEERAGEDHDAHVKARDMADAK